MDANPINWKAAQVNASGLDVLLLGCVDFDAFLMLQDRLAAELNARQDRSGFLLLCEHPPLFTLGRDGSVADLPSDPDDLECQRLPVRWVARGGGTWRHGPGQLTVSVLAPIERLRFSPGEFRQILIQAVLDTAQELHVNAHGVTDVPGVQGRIGQFAFVGASVQSGISQFGMIVNVAPGWDVTSFSPGGVRSSSLAAEHLRPIAMATVRECLARHLAAGLNYEDVHLRTGHPWLRRIRKTVPVHA